MAESFDFQINDLKFRAATSDAFPYARATAPFRKEQFDSAPTVGDQSLSGWWTRGQLSFHRGAGVKYYEVLDGDEVLNRYRTSTNVEVFEPGQATLNNEMAEWVASPGDVKALSSGSALTPFFIASVGGGSNLLYRASGWAPGSTASVVTMTGTEAVGIAADPGAYFYVATNAGSTGRIERFPAIGGAGTVLYQDAAKVLRGVWHAKGRLWVIDSDGNIHTVAKDPTGALPASFGTEVATLDTVSASDPCSLAEAGSAVFLSVGTNLIYRIGIDPDGSVPTLAAPVVAAELPIGELVGALRYYLGHLVVVTSRGVRVALVQSDGSLIFGPHIIKWAGYGTSVYSRSIAVAGSSVYVMGAETYDEVAVFRIDLARSLDDALLFPYEEVWNDGGSVLTNATYGVTEHWLGVAVYGQGVLRNNTPYGNLETSGELTTAYHRFGTLEGKHFAGVRVRAGGDGGTIKTYLIDQDGTETLLGTVDVATSDGADVSLVTSPPAEAIALRFVLERSTLDPGMGPELLGYQIKALPSPQRQRLIKWPLMIQDVVRDRYGVSRGTREGAWTAWSEIEALEESDALVTFTDHRTGETGEAYIESLELQTDTPSQGANSGFGGVGYLTLRKVS